MKHSTMKTYFSILALFAVMAMVLCACSSGEPSDSQKKCLQAVNDERGPGSSKEGLTTGLKDSGYSDSDIKYAFENSNIDFKEEVALMAGTYKKNMPNEEDLLDQLKFDLFTDEEIDYAMELYKDKNDEESIQAEIDLHEHYYDNK